MQDPPHIDVRLSLDVEDQIRKPPHDPRAQAGEIQLTCKAGRIACGMLAHAEAGVSRRVDEGQCKLPTVTSIEKRSAVAASN